LSTAALKACDPSQETFVTDTITESERPLRADARRNRDRILESAREVFAEKGAEAQIDDVARRAGVGVGTVYRHFPHKEALMGELVRRQFRLFADRACDALENVEADDDAFAALGGVMRRNAETTAGDAAVRYAMTVGGQHIWDQARVEQQELLLATEEFLVRARRAGTVRPDTQASDIAMLMCGVCSTMGTDRPEFDWRRHLELVFAALRPSE
jgi:AcrR family transcriptional regulator